MIKHYVLGTKYYMLIYRYTNHLKVISYSYSNFDGCVNTSLLYNIFFFLLKVSYPREVISKI